MNSETKSGPALISIIVPAYNAAAFLRRCADSVRTQTFIRWELLIVENGSTDETTAVGTALSEEDSRIRLLHSDKGVSNARNRGITEAAGDFITFLDADDCLLPDALMVLADGIGAHPGCEMAVAGIEGKPALTEQTMVYTGDNVEAARIRFMREPTRFLSVWGKLYATDLLRRSGVRFDKELTHAEDSDFLIALLCFCRQLVLLPSPVYHYYINPASATHTSGGLAEKYSLSLTRTGERLRDDSEAVRAAYRYYVLDNLLVLLVHETFAPGVSGRDGRRAAAAVLALPVFQEALGHADLSAMPRVKRLVLQAAAHHRLHLVQTAIRLRQWQNARRH